MSSHNFLSPNDLIQWGKSPVPKPNVMSTEVVFLGIIGKLTFLMLKLFYPTCLCSALMLWLSKHHACITPFWDLLQVDSTVPV